MALEQLSQVHLSLGQYVEIIKYAKAAIAIHDNGGPNGIMLSGHGGKFLCVPSPKHTLVLECTLKP